MKTLHLTCTEPRCHDRHHARGFCQHHYNIYRGKILKAHDPAASEDTESFPAACQVEGCSRPLLVRGMCVKHYFQYRDDLY